MIINLCEHEITVFDEKGERVEVFEKCEKKKCARVETFKEKIGFVDGTHSLTKTVFGEPQNVPPRKDGVYYIVSRLFKNAVPNRDDCIVPETIRNRKGEIIGCNGFSL